MGRRKKELDRLAKKVVKPSEENIMNRLFGSKNMKDATNFGYSDEVLKDLDRLLGPNAKDIPIDDVLDNLKNGRNTPGVKTIANTTSGGGRLVGDAYEKGFDLISDGPKDIVPRMSDIPDVVPEKTGRGLIPAARGKADDAIEAAFRKVAPKMGKKGILKGLGKAAAIGTGVGGLALGAMEMFDQPDAGSLKEDTDAEKKYGMYRRMKEAQAAAGSPEEKTQIEAEAYMRAKNPDLPKDMFQSTAEVPFPVGEGPSSNEGYLNALAPDLDSPDDSEPLQVNEEQTKKDIADIVSKPPVKEGKREPAGDFRTRLMAKLDEIQAESKDEIEAGRRRDNLMQGISLMVKGAVGLQNAGTGTQSGVHTGPQDTPMIETDFAGQATSDRDANIKALMEKYKILRGGEQADQQKRSSELNAQLRRDAIDAKEEYRGMSGKKKMLDSARSLLKDDPRFKKATEQSMEFETVSDIINEVRAGNQNSLAMLGTKLARAMGEVGVLTDTDVVRYVGSTSWGRKLKEWYNKGAKGTLPEPTLREMEKNISVIQQKLKQNVDKVYSNAQSRLMTAYPNLDKDTASGLLGVPSITLASEKADDMVTVNGKDGTTAEYKIGQVIHNRATNVSYRVNKNGKFEKID